MTESLNQSATKKKAKKRKKNKSSTKGGSNASPASDGPVSDQSNQLPKVAAIAIWLIVTKNNMNNSIRRYLRLPGLAQVTNPALPLGLALALDPDLAIANLKVTQIVLLWMWLIL